MPSRGSTGRTGGPGRSFSPATVSSFGRWSRRSLRRRPQPLALRHAANPFHRSANFAIVGAQLGGDLFGGVALDAHFENLPLVRAELAHEPLELIEEFVRGFGRRLVVEHFEQPIVLRA